MGCERGQATLPDLFLSLRRPKKEQVRKGGLPPPASKYFYESLRELFGPILNLRSDPSPIDSVKRSVLSAKVR